MSKEIVADDGRINSVDYYSPPTNHSPPTVHVDSSFSNNLKRASDLAQEFPLSSDLEEEEEGKDPLKELLRICSSSRFTIPRGSDTSEEEADTLPGDAKKKRIRKPRSRKKKNNFVIYSYSEYFTEEVEAHNNIAIEETQEDESRLSVEEFDRLGLLSSDPEFLKDWESYWALHGQDILWRTWNEKYRDYINPNYDLVDEIKNIPICSDSSSDEKDDINMPTEGSTVVKLSDKTREMLKRRQDEKKETGPKNPDELWQETWNNHCQDEYTGEYQNYAKKYNKLPKLDFITGEDAKNNSCTRKYYAQRYELFSKYDEGIRLDCESWFSVTPEQIAIHNAKKCSVVGKDKVILDAFAGCGGNTIQFAKIFDKVIAIDIDPIKIENCRHNARIYGVEDKIEFIVGDFMELAEKTGLDKLKADVVFLSPPWGGPNYQCKDVFNINTMIPMNGSKLFQTAQKISNDIAYFLPRNVNQNQLLQLAGAGNFVEIENNFHNNKVKTVTAYYGNLITRTDNIGVDLTKLNVSS